MQAINKHSHLQQIRKDYQDISQHASSGRLGRINAQSVRTRQLNIIEELKFAEKMQNKQQIEQLKFYQQKYSKLQTLMTEATLKSYTRSRYQGALINLLDQIPIKSTPSQVKQQKYKTSNAQRNSLGTIKQQSSIYQINSHNQGIQSKITTEQNFFKEHQSKIKNSSKITFKDILQDPQISKKSFKIKSSSIQKNPYQLQALRQKNYQLKQLLRQQEMKIINHSRHKHNYQQDRIKQLQIRKIQLMEINRQRKNQSQGHSQKSYKQNHRQVQNHQSDVMAPYVIKIKQANLRRISDINLYRIQQQKNKIQINQSIISNQSYQQFLKNPKNQINKRTSQQKFYQNNNFQSLLSPYNAKQYQQKISGISNQQICSRNKISFFKQSLILIRTYQYQIAYKKNKLIHYSQQQIIIFFNNKTNKNYNISIKYKNNNHYKIFIKSSINDVKQFGEGRQVIIVSIDQKYWNGIFDSIIDFQVLISQDGSSLDFVNNSYGNHHKHSFQKQPIKIYQLWLPATFILFDYHYRPQSLIYPRESYCRIKIIPDKQFSSYQSSIQAGLPLLSKQQIDFETIAYLYGTMKDYEGSIKITWKNDFNRRLLIQGNQKWVYWLGFILGEYKPETY